jgi:hypothetical protein
MGMRRPRSATVIISFNLWLNNFYILLESVAGLI